MVMYTEPGQVPQACVAALLAGDDDAITERYEDDAILVAPGGQVIRGKAAIRTFYADGLRAFEFTDVQLGAREETVVGDWAFCTSTSTMKMRSLNTSDQATGTEGVETEILHRGLDGGWRYHVDHVSNLSSTTS